MVPKVAVCKNFLAASTVREFKVRSRSEPGKLYTIVVSPIGAMCDCTGWEYRQHCTHVARVCAKHVCDWSEDDEVPWSEKDRQNLRCPKCHGPVRYI